MGNLKPLPKRAESRIKPRPKVPTLRRPDWLTPEQKRAWDGLLRACKAAEVQLDLSDTPVMVQTATLYAQLRSGPEAFDSAKHTQLRLLLQGLGLADTKPRE